jgi:tetratricopeptide (TPR) repeat protein
MLGAHKRVEPTGLSLAATRERRAPAAHAHTARSRSFRRIFCGVTWVPSMSNKPDRATAVIWSNRGKDERDRGLFVRALACFDKALEFDPKYPLALSNKAQALLDLWRVEEAGQCASRALSLGSTMPVRLHQPWPLEPLPRLIRPGARGF